MTTEHFTLALPGLPAQVRVTSATGKETMNALYRFDVGVLVEADDAFAQRVMETPASLAMHFDGVPVRMVHGIVSACRATGRDHAGRAIHTLRLVPRLARLKKRRTSRIFQDLTTREIVEQVLAISRVANRWQLVRDLPKRAYCVQYDETDHAFVTRLCAADGIFFSFDHPLGDAGAEEILVLADHVASYAPIDGPAELRLRAPGDSGDGGALTVAEDHVQRFDLRHAMTTKRVLLRRFDFERPPIPRRDAAGLDGALHTDDREEMRAFVDQSATVYDHEHTREQALLEPIHARTALEAETAQGAVVEAETAGRRLLPGRRFRLVDHPLAELDGEYVVTSCAHECREPAVGRLGQPVFRNRFTAVPASVPFRAARPPRTVRQSLETAIVVGPAGEEIHTDELGRVKVQFHWDLEGSFDDSSSAWLRVSQAWAGTGYGAQFLPRVGHEVLVGYIDDDADRPVVLGSLHNGNNQTPFTFPRDKTQSGIKTWTSPDGQGGHELLFEDRAGSELVALRSNRTLALAGAEDSSLGAERDMRLTSGRDRTDVVLGDAKTRIDGDEQRTTKGNRRTRVDGNDDQEVKGRREAEVDGYESLRVKRWEMRVVGGGRTTVIGADPQEPGSDQLSVSGRYGVGSVDEMHLSSEKRIVIECGKSKITLHPDSIVLDSPTIQLQASDRIALLQGDGPAALLTLQGSAPRWAAGRRRSSREGSRARPLRGSSSTRRRTSTVPLVKLNCGPMGGGAGKRHRGSRREGRGDVHRAARGRRGGRRLGHPGHRHAERGGRRARVPCGRERDDGGQEGGRVHGGRDARRGQAGSRGEEGPRRGLRGTRVMPSLVKKMFDTMPLQGVLGAAATISGASQPQTLGQVKRYVKVHRTPPTYPAKTLRRPPRGRRTGRRGDLGVAGGGRPEPHREGDLPGARRELRQPPRAREHRVWQRHDRRPEEFSQERGRGLQRQDGRAAPHVGLSLPVVQDATDGLHPPRTTRMRSPLASGVVVPRAQQSLLHVFAYDVDRVTLARIALAHQTKRRHPDKKDVDAMLAPAATR